MPQMGPLGWAWVSVFVVLVLMIYLVMLYFLFICFYTMGEGKVEFVSLVWLW